jgi:pectate lyase
LIVQLREKRFHSFSEFSKQIELRFVIFLIYSHRHIQTNIRRFKQVKLDGSIDVSFVSKYVTISYLQFQTLQVVDIINENLRQIKGTDNASYST